MDETIKVETKVEASNEPVVNVTPEEDEHMTPNPPVHNGPPVHEVVGGSSVRQYLNKHLTATLLDGLKLTAKQQPEDPLLFLGQYLIDHSQSGTPGGVTTTVVLTKQE